MVLLDQDVWIVNILEKFLKILIVLIFVIKVQKRLNVLGILIFHNH